MATADLPSYDEAMHQKQEQHESQQPSLESPIKGKVMISYAWQPPESAKVAQELNLLLKVIALFFSLPVFTGEMRASIIARAIGRLSLCENLPV